MSNEIIEFSVVCLIVYSILVYAAIFMTLFIIAYAEDFIFGRSISTALGITTIVLFFKASFFKRNGLEPIYYYLRLILFTFYLGLTSISSFILIKKISKEYLKFAL